MPIYPDYIHQMLARARDEGHWHAAQADAAAICFDVLALFPDCEEAQELVYELFCDEWMIYDNRVAIQQNIDEWDDRPWQQRRRLALSYRFTSRWGGKYKDQKMDRDGPSDIAKILEDGKMELLGAYCLGDEECTDYAWSIFADALNKAKDPRLTLFWIGKQYADMGFFADAAEALGELCSRFNDADARRLLAELIWWRDNAHRIPWIPPAGDGSRYDQMMEFIDPSAPKTDNQRERIAPYHPSIDSKITKLFASNISNETEKPVATLVDWSFLDKDDGQPGEPADWVKKQIKRFQSHSDDEDMKEIIEEMQRMQRWTRNITPPSTPPRYDPNEPPFDPGEFFGFADLDLDDDEPL